MTTTGVVVGVGVGVVLCCVGVGVGVAAVFAAAAVVVALLLWLVRHLCFSLSSSACVLTSTLVLLPLLFRSHLLHIICLFSPYKTRALLLVFNTR